MPISQIHLPSQPTRLIDREQDLAHLDAFLAADDIRLLTLTGPGGVGKTRLAIAAAERVAQHFPDGVWFVDLAPLIDSALVLPTISEVIGVREQPGEDPLTGLCNFLRDRQVLLVVDNLEHVLAVASDLDALLAACPRVKMLTTSREPLRLRREQVVEVQPLRVPEARPDAWSIASLEVVPTVALFVARARAADADFALSDRNAAAVAELSRRLEGLPLAVELAAARVRFLEPSALLARMERRLALLQWDAPDLPIRHKTLRATLDWSYALLSPGQQALFRQLGVFVGGFTLEAADAMVDTGDLELEVLTGVAALLDNSLLRRVERASGSPRYTMLETVREFALDQLQESGEMETSRRRHAEYFAEFAEQIERNFHGPEELTCLHYCHADLSNLRAALEWSSGEGGDLEPGLRLAGALWMFWRRGGSRVPGRPQRDRPVLMTESLTWLARELERGGTAPAAVRARALATAGFLEHTAGNQHGLIWLEESVALARTTADRFALARALHFLGFCRLISGEHEAAIGAIEEAIEEFRTLAEMGWMAAGLCFLSEAVALSGDTERARVVAADALGVSQETQFETGQALAYGRLGRFAFVLGDYSEAERYLSQALALWLEHDDWYSVAVEATACAHLAAARGEPARALRLAGAADALYDVLGIDPALDHDAVARDTHLKIGVDHNQTLDRLRALLGEERFAAEWAAGHGNTPEEALATVRAVVSGDEVTAAATGSVSSTEAGLSPREREVLALVARGYTNKQIGEALFISPRTVNFHVTNLLAKLELESRAAAAAFAVRHGLA